jgi:hypothetical protein
MVVTAVYPPLAATDFDNLNDIRVVANVRVCPRKLWLGRSRRGMRVVAVFRVPFHVGVRVECSVIDVVVTAHE